MPGSADLCFLTDENVEKVLEVFQEARVEVWTLLFFPLANGANGADKRLISTDSGRRQGCRKNRGRWEDSQCIRERS
jgi:hypothetical protein